MKDEIKLGDRVKDKVTGFVGIAVSRTQFFNGCIQYQVKPKMQKSKEGENKIPDASMFDWQQLEVIDKEAVTVKEKPTGGDQPEPPRFN